MIVGVGGQGTILAARLVGMAAMARGLDVRGSETIGMAQRGGSVVSHVRVAPSAEWIPSPLIPLGMADALVGFEPGEAVRCLPYVKPGGALVVCDRAVPPVTATLSAALNPNHPPYDGQAMVRYLRGRMPRLIVVREQDVVEACGTAKPLNAALIGALAALGVTGLSLDDIALTLDGKVRPQFREVNHAALVVGVQAASHPRA